MKGYIMQEELTDHIKKPTNKIIIQRQGSQEMLGKALFFCIEALMVFWWSVIKTTFQIAGVVFGVACHIVGKFLHIKLVEPWQDFFMKTSGLFKFYALSAIILVFAMVGVTQWAYLSAWS